MNDIKHTPATYEQRQRLLALCRFLSVCFCYRFTLVLLAVTGLCFTLCGHSQFAPYGTALVCLILPVFLSGSQKNTKKENNDSPLSVLYRRYRYSPSVFSAYRISLLLCTLLLFVWHMVQPDPVTLFGISVALLYAVVTLALYPILSRVFYLLFHHRLMTGRL